MLSPAILTAAHRAGNRDRKIIRRLARQGPRWIDRCDPVEVKVDEARADEDLRRETADEELREAVEVGG